MLKIRLTRVGKKNSPAYRVVVADQRKAVKRKFIEILGHYNPTTSPKTLVIDKERTLHWISRGAQASDTVNNLMVDLGILAKDKKVNKIYAKKKETEVSEQPEVEAETPSEEKAESEEEKAETKEATQEPNSETVEDTVEEK